MPAQMTVVFNYSPPWQHHFSVHGRRLHCAENIINVVSVGNIIIVVSVAAVQPGYM